MGGFPPHDGRPPQGAGRSAWRRLRARWLQGGRPFFPALEPAAAPAGAAGEQAGAGLGGAGAGLPAPAHAARQPGLRRAGVRLRAAVKEPTTRKSGRTTTMRKDRKSVGAGKSESVSVELGGRRIIKKKKRI